MKFHSPQNISAASGHNSVAASPQKLKLKENSEIAPCSLRRSQHIETDVIHPLDMQSSFNNHFRQSVR